MNKLIYDYQLERYETARFIKRVFSGFFKKTENKKPKWDNKAKFLMIVGYFQFLLLSSLLIFFSPYYIAIPTIIILWLGKFIFLVVSNIAYLPIEKKRNDKKIELAKQKIDDFHDLTKIGIAGSSGKSSVKEILDSLLQKNTLTTGEDENTLMGTAKIIGKKLDQYHKTFICEMNICKNGEIKKICELITPGIGILPSINEQHLERFKSIENTVNTKFELLQNLKVEGIGIVNLDEQLINSNLKKALPTKLIGYTLEGRENELCQQVVSAQNIFMGPKGSSFSLEISGQLYFFKSPLLGKKHLSNLIASIICAVELGKAPSGLVKTVSQLEQVQGRLEYKTYNGIHILDDTRSCNVSGYKEALHVLNMFDGSKVIATPGIFEIGHKSNEVHKLLGYLASQATDLILLIGKSDRTENIKSGALDNNFNKKNIIRLKDVDEVYKFVDKNLKERDVVLLENNLPERFL